MIAASNPIKTVTSSETALRSRRERTVNVNSAKEISGQASSFDTAQADNLKDFTCGFEFLSPLSKALCPDDARFVKFVGDKDPGQTFSCAQMTSIDAGNLAWIERGGLKKAFTYEDDYAQYCRIIGIAPENPVRSRSEQCADVFSRLEEILDSCGFAFTDTARTWFYLDKLLDWYAEFNSVRTDFFIRKGVFDKLVPASTGIGIGNLSGGALSADLYAVKPKNTKCTVRPVSSPLQGEAGSYKSSFSRAVEIQTPEEKRLLLSGTASIDKAGRSIYVGDGKGQIAETMRVVSALLESRGMPWSSVSRAIAYFIDKDDIPIFQTHCLSMGIRGLPCAYALTDICRADLSFEIELDAVIRLN